MDKINVKYISTRFVSDGSPFSIVKMYNLDTKEHIICKGNFVLPTDYEYFAFEGYYVEDAKYGKQFNVDHFVIEQNVDSVIETLSSPLFKGIGKKSASDIANHLGSDAIALLQNDITLIDDIPISPKQKISLKNGIQQLAAIQPQIETLLRNNISIRTISYLQSYYQEKLDAILLENPYRIIHDIPMLGFQKVDEIGLILNEDPLNQNRLGAICYYLCSQSLFKSGATLMLQSTLYDRMNDYLQGQLLADVFFMVLETELKQRHLATYHDYVTLFSLYDAEMTIFDKISSLKDTKINLKSKFTLDDISDYGTDKGITYDATQLACIETALNSSELIITGGPGTGKTTILDAVINLLQAQDEHLIAVVAPTGRAAKRLSEACQFEAMTIHRMLKWDLHTNKFSHNEENPLFYTCLIIDEMSMVDAVLFSALIKALPYVQRIILVGDYDQLPSVGCGNILKDLINHSDLTTLSLQKVFRQKEGSTILEFVHHVKNGEYCASLIDGTQMHFIPQEEQDILTTSADIYLNVLQEEKDVQILIPKYLGRNGINAFNQYIQQQLHNDTPSLYGYHVNDKVIQLKNNNDILVYNGDIGTVHYINEAAKNLIVVFDGKTHIFNVKDLDQLNLAYAISVHKAQGTEYQRVILPLSSEYSFMYQRNLIYTALSRAKKEVYLVGSEKVLVKAIHRQEMNERITLLKQVLAYSQYDSCDDKIKF